MKIWRKVCKACGQRIPLTRREVEMLSWWRRLLFYRD